MSGNGKIIELLLVAVSGSVLKTASGQHFAHVEGSWSSTESDEEYVREVMVVSVSSASSFLEWK